jgi:glutathione S-transferase
MIELLQFPSAWTLPSMSPFCVKAEVFLNMVELPYKKTILINPNKMPKGKLPVIKDKGKYICDSSFIIDYLIKNYALTIDAHLSNEDKAYVTMIQRMVEEHLYFCMVYSRWVDKTGINVIKPGFKEKFSYGLHHIIFFLIQSTAKRALKAQGIGRHKKQEIYQIGIDDINACAYFLAEKDYIMGKTICSLDATVFAFLFSILHTPIDNPLKECMHSHPNLTNYCQNMSTKYLKAQDAAQ